VLAEILLPYSWKLQGLGLIEMELSGSGMLKAEELVRKYPRPGCRDILSLVLAMQEKAILLAGDEALRKAASREGIEVHGTLWLLDPMVKEEAISKIDGCRSLDRMINSGRRLPKK
jgi:predicted nucleic acid-binding protein